MDVEPRSMGIWSQDSAGQDEHPIPAHLIGGRWSAKRNGRLPLRNPGLDWARRAELAGFHNIACCPGTWAAPEYWLQWDRIVALRGHRRRRKVRKWPFLRLSLVSSCSYWPESSLTFSAGPLQPPTSSLPSLLSSSSPFSWQLSASPSTHRFLWPLSGTSGACSTSY